MYCTMVDISFLEMGLYAVDTQAALYCYGTGCYLESVPSIALAAPASPGYGQRCIGNDGYPSGFL